MGMRASWVLHRWPTPDPDIRCDWCGHEPAIGEACAGAVAVWVVGAQCWARSDAARETPITSMLVRA